MALPQFGVPATQLSPADTRAAKFVKQPVKDESGNVMLGVGLDMAGQAIEGYQMASLEKEQEKVIDEYMGRRPEALGQQQIDLATTKSSIDSIWEKAGSVEQLDAAVNPIEKNFQERLAKFERARDQGVMSPSDFNDRILATTREAVNKMPGLYDKLLQHSKKVLGLSGIEGVLDADIAKQKTQDDSLKNLRELADTMHVSYNTFAPDYQQMQQDVHKRQQQISASDQLDRAVKADSRVTAEQAKTWVANEGSNLITGDTFLITKNAATMFAGATPADYPKIKAKLRLDAMERHNAFVAKTNQLGIRNDPTTAALIADHKQTLDYTLETIDGLESGADAEKALTHAYTIIEKTQELGLASRYNIGAMNLMKKIPEAMWSKLLVSEGTQNLTKMMTLSQDIFNEAVSAPSTVDSLSEYKDDPANPTAVTTGMGMIDNTKDEGELAVNSTKIINFFHSGMADGNFKTEEDKIKYLDSVFKQMGDPKRKDKLKFADAEAQANAFKMTDEYFQTVGAWREKKFNEALNDGSSVYADLLPDGRVTFRSNNPKVQAEFNTKFAARINDGVATMANLLGVTRQEASTTILPRYRQVFGIETNIQTGPKPITGATPPVVAAPKQGTPTKADYRITPAQQGERDKTRIRVLRSEINDFGKQLQKETNAAKRKMIEDNIKYVEQELTNLEQK